MKKTDEPIIVEQIFKSSKSDVWKAITELKQMKQWFFNNIESFKPEVGFETKFIIQNEDRVFPHLWKVTDVEPMSKITYNWKYEGYRGDAYVHFELFEQKLLQTKVRLTHQVIESFPSDVPEFTRDSCIGGWNYFIKQNLKSYLEKT